MGEQIGKVEGCGIDLVEVERVRNQVPGIVAVERGRR